MGSLLGDPSVLQDHDDVGMPDRRDAMRDDNRCPVPHQTRNRLRISSLGDDIHRRQRIVQDQDARIQDHGQGNGRSLFWPPESVMPRSPTACLVLALVAMLAVRARLVGLARAMTAT